MLELKKITKIYETEGYRQTALDNVSLNFRKNEFASILGASGSGKTTLLNIIGGLDSYTSGDLIINETSTKKYKDRDWDTYRNHRVGFVFQSYNLIPHQSVISNVELALTLVGISKSERKKRAKEVLEKVGLKDHIHKKPSQLSGGQMQRVAIARALINNPDIILADEPTGALDSETSVQIMNLLKEVAKEKLVIMVTHNPELAEEYSTRIIRLKDGKIIDDTNPYDGKVNTSLDKEKKKAHEKKTSMNLKTALSLSLNNLMTKKGRTLLTAFAGSIGIIGIALILSLSSGVQNYINKVQEETLTSYPLTIERKSIDITSAMEDQNEKMKKEEEERKKDKKDKVYSNNTLVDTLSLMSSQVQTNNLEQFKKYVEENKDLKKYTSSIGYEYNLHLQLYKSDLSNGVVQVNPNTVLDNIGMGSAHENPFLMSDVFAKMFNNEDINSSMYEVVTGRLPKEYNEVVLLVNKDNEISDFTLYALGLKDQKELKEMFEKVKNGEKIESKQESYSYQDLVGLNFKLLLNSDCYEKENNLWIDKRENEEKKTKKLEEAEEIKVVGIIRPNEDSVVASTTTGGIFYTNDLEKYVINKINESEVVKAQKENKDVNILTGISFHDEEFSVDKLSMEQKMYLQSLSSEELADVITKYKEQSNKTYEDMLEELGSVDLEKPSAIYMYAKDFKAKDEIKDIIKDYNDKQKKDGKDSNVINYNDLVGMLMSSVTSIVDMISYVLIGFVSISLIVSSIMIGIITYISVLERTKEIGILRAIGASKKDVSRVFNAETFIVGLVAGMLGIIVTLLLNIPINAIIKEIAGVKGLSSLPMVGAIVLIAISVILTLIAGLIPSRIASKKDPVESLRSE